MSDIQSYLSTIGYTPDHERGAFTKHNAPDIPFTALAGHTVESFTAWMEAQAGKEKGSWIDYAARHLQREKDKAREELIALVGEREGKRLLGDADATLPLSDRSAEQISAVLGSFMAGVSLEVFMQPETDYQEHPAPASIVKKDHRAGLMAPWSLKRENDLVSTLSLGHALDRLINEQLTKRLSAKRFEAETMLDPSKRDEEPPTEKPYLGAFTDPKKWS